MIVKFTERSRAPAGNLFDDLFGSACVVNTDLATREELVSALISLHREHERNGELLNRIEEHLDAMGMDMDMDPDPASSSPPFIVHRKKAVAAHRRHLAEHRRWLAGETAEE